MPTTIRRGARSPSPHRGSVAVEPDQARLTSGVTAEGSSAREALTANSAAMQKVVGELKSAGIDPKDIQTSSFRVEPRYTRPAEGEAPKIDGYSVANEVQVQVRDLEKVGDILDRLVTAGANQSSGLSFEVSKAETALDDARKQAVANARRRAELYAAAAGVEVGEVLTITEGDAAAPPQPVFRAMKAASVPIERGTETLEASVTITWALK
ncbi:MAG: SIMPL domain-containing protein [Hyphomicrobium sp.]